MLTAGHLNRGCPSALYITEELTSVTILRLRLSLMLQKTFGIATDLDTATLLAAEQSQGPEADMNFCLL